MLYKVTKLKNINPKIIKNNLNTESLAVIDAN